MTQEENIEIIVKTNTNEMPEYTTKGACGADLRACLDAPITIKAGKTALIPTGLFFEIPEGYEVQIRPRSGLAFKYGITVLNTPGTIDSDYRGEIKIILINHSNEDFIIEDKMRIAQMVVAKALQAEFILKEELSLTARGEGGFGHTGV